MREKETILSPDVRKLHRSREKNSQVMFSSAADYCTVTLASTAKLYSIRDSLREKESHSSNGTSRTNLQSLQSVYCGNEAVEHSKRYFHPQFKHSPQTAASRVLNRQPSMREQYSIRKLYVQVRNKRKLFSNPDVREYCSTYYGTKNRVV